MIMAENLTKYYQRTGSPALDKATFDINDGEIVGFAGLNGAGKTTTLRILSGIIVPSSGTVKVDGHDIVRNKIRASMNIGMVPELPNFDITQKPEVLLRYYAGFYGLDRKTVDDKIESLMKTFEIWDARTKRLRAYSQGMKKRFAITAALLPDPRNILLDETLNGLDPEGVRDMRLLMLDLKKQGKAVFLSSHILSELENVADRVFIIKQGSIVKSLDRAELPKLGSMRMELSVQNPNEDLVQKLESYGTLEQNAGDFTVRNIKVSSDKAYLVNSELSKKGFIITRFQVTGEGLEDYFLSLVAGDGS